MQAIEQPAHDDRVLDDAAEIAAGADLARRQMEGRFLEPGADEEPFVVSLVFQILRALAALHLVERRLGDEEMASLDQLRHLPEEEGQQQGADMRAVDVGVGHDDDLVIAQLLGVELVLADAGTECRDQRADHLRRQHAVEPGALDV